MADSKSAHGGSIPPFYAIKKMRKTLSLKKVLRIQTKLQRRDIMKRIAHPSDLRQQIINHVNSGKDYDSLRKLFPKIPKSTLYGWIKSQQALINNTHKTILPTTPDLLIQDVQPTKVEAAPHPVRNKPGPKPGKKITPKYEKVHLDATPPPKPQVKKKNIVLVCSEDPQAILDVLKGMM